MSEMAAPQHIGFLTLEQTKQKDGYIGAILVTDSRGVPVDFRATHPVKPSAVQKTLYGDALEPYVALELCGKQLLQAVRTKPDLLIVSRPDLLDIHRNAKCPVAYYAAPVRPSRSKLTVGRREVESIHLPGASNRSLWTHRQEWQPMRTVYSNSSRLRSITLTCWNRSSGLRRP